MSFISFKYLDSNTITVTGSRNSNNVMSQYLRNGEGIPFNIAPFIVPYNCFLVNITANSPDAATWTVKITSNGSPILGAELELNNETTKIQQYAIQLTAGQRLEIMLETNAPIKKPVVNLILQKNI
jgi:hypothetical protein